MVSYFPAPISEFRVGICMSLAKLHVIEFETIIPKRV